MEKQNLFGNINPKDFDKLFSTKEACLKWISEQKWDNGFVCRKCGNTNYCDGNTPYSKRCTRCKSIESATAHTLFHRCKISLPEAFRLTFEICTEPNISSRKLSQKIEVRNMTCWSLKTKLILCLEQGGCDAFFGRPIINKIVNL